MRPVLAENGREKDGHASSRVREKVVDIQFGAPQNPAPSRLEFPAFSLIAALLNPIQSGSLLPSPQRP